MPPRWTNPTGGVLCHQIIDECLDLGGCHGLRCGLGLLHLIVLGLGIALLPILNKFLQTLPSLALELHQYHFVCHVLGDFLRFKHLIPWLWEARHYKR